MEKEGEEHREWVHQVIHLQTSCLFTLNIADFPKNG